MKREVIYVLERENDAKTIRTPVAACGTYLEAVAMAAPFHEIGGWHRRIFRHSIKVAR